MSKHTHDEKLMFLQTFLTSDTTNLNKIYYNQGNNKNHLITSQVKLVTSEHLNKNFYNKLLKLQEKEFLSLEIILHPKVFFNLTKMFLLSNNAQIMKSFQKKGKISDIYINTEF